MEVTISEIADYEVRRELLRAGKQNGIARLTALRSFLRFAPVTSPSVPPNFGRRPEIPGGNQPTTRRSMPA
jgi:hypothetical protein